MSKEFDDLQAREDIALERIGSALTSGLLMVLHRVPARSAWQRLLSGLDDAERALAAEPSQALLDVVVTAVEAAVAKHLGFENLPALEEGIKNYEKEAKKKALAEIAAEKAEDPDA